MLLLLLVSNPLLTSSATAAVAAEVPAPRSHAPGPERPDPIFAFDSQWMGASPFVAGAKGFELSVKMGPARKIVFPLTLDSDTPIVVHTGHDTVQQYLVSNESLHGSLHGRYLVYRGEDRAILYRYDVEQRALREFVYLADETSLAKDRVVVRWRFEGGRFHARGDGSVAVVKKDDPVGEARRISNGAMAGRIGKFLEKRYDKEMTRAARDRTLFVIPPPIYVDAEGNEVAEGIDYRIHEDGEFYSLNGEGDTLHLVLGDHEDLAFPIWADPTLIADLDADLVLNGQSAGDLFGFSVASAGDFNGDGIDDIIVGARSDDNSGSGSGSAFIFFGGVTGTVTDPDLDADVILDGQRARDDFGFSVASAGDFNGDGLDDVLVGAPFDDNNGTSSGVAFIFFGRAGFTGRISEPDINADVVIVGQSKGDELGYSVASAGDFNDDGVDDVIVGAWRDDDGGSNSGAAFIFFGGAGLAGTIANPDTDADVALYGQSAGDAFGSSVASAGDFSGDGVDDVIIGARTDDDAGSNAGSAFIFFGGSPGTISDPDLNADVVLHGQSANDLFGWSVASAGDFDGDGLSDVIVGARRDDNNGNESGSAFLYFGGVTGTITDPDTQADVVLHGQGAGDEFGYSVAPAGDFNGDGLDDVIVGAWLDDNGGTNAGCAFIFFGGVFGTITDPDTQADVMLDGPSAGDEFGYSVASTGDLDDDGAGDVVVGARSDDDNGSNAGGAFAFHGEVVNQPPIADAGNDLVLEQQGPAGSTVILDGSGSSDPDDDPLTFSWAGPFGSASGQNPTVLVPAGTHVITLTVSDGLAADTASVYVTVADNLPPVLTLPGDVTSEATSSAGAVVSFTAPSASDAADPAPVVSCDNTSGNTFPLGETTVSCTATDTNGNSAGGSFLVTVLDTTPPDVTASLNLVDSAQAAVASATADVATGNRLSVEYSATDLVDPSPVVEAVLNVGGVQQILVSHGELVEFERVDKVVVTRTNGILRIEAPSLVLNVTATDFSGVAATAEAPAPEVAPAPPRNPRLARLEARIKRVQARLERVQAKLRKRAEKWFRWWKKSKYGWWKPRAKWWGAKTRRLKARAIYLKVKLRWLKAKYRWWSRRTR